MKIIRLTLRSAFTLIELLVVISIIAILAGIALPVYSKVMEKARATDQGSQLKQLGLGMAAYLNDNDEQFPSSSGSGATAWPKVLQEKYVTNWKVFHSPFDKRPLGSGDTTTVSYGINDKILTQAGKPGWDGNASKLAAPSQLILMAPAMTKDAGSTPVFEPANLANTSVALNSKPVAGKLGTHNNRNLITALFADSHVANMPYNGEGNPESFIYMKTETSGPMKDGVAHWDPIPPKQ